MASTVSGFQIREDFPWVIVSEIDPNSGVDTYTYIPKRNVVKVITLEDTANDKYSIKLALTDGTILNHLIDGSAQDYSYELDTILTGLISDTYNINVNL